MPRLLSCVPFALLMLCAARAEAHFIWADCHAGKDGSAEVRLYFGEGPQPGETHLIEKIGHAKAWLRDADGKTRDLAVARAADAKLAALVAPAESPDRACIEASCDYGIYQRGATAVLVQYYAKHLPADWPRQGDKFARSERLALDVVPRFAGDSLVLTVLYQGEPAANQEVVVIDPAAQEQKLKSNAAGQVTFDKPGAGRYAVRAAYIQADRSGERDGKAFSQTWHYSTLTFDVPQPGSAASAGDGSAAELLARARQARAVWRDFPGFTADLVVSDGAMQLKGKATIDAEHNVQVEMPKSAVRDWAEEQLNSLVQHRMPDGEVSQSKVVYADGDRSHPLGRKIDLGDTDLKSTYRIDGDVIREVNRNMGSLRFTISVLQIEWNAEKKYLPRCFTMNFFDLASGELRSSRTYRNDWQRVGAYDLPKTILEIGANSQGGSTRQIAFENVRLLEGK